MSTSKKFLTIFVIAMAFGQVYAQSQEEKLAQAREAQAELLRQAEMTEQRRRDAEVQMERAAAELSRAAQEQERAHIERNVEIDVRMREAERALAEAAERMAELSMRQLPRVAMVERIVRANRGPVLGVTIGDEGKDGPVEGVSVIGVSPGGAAADAGLRAGDIITSINNESLTAQSSAQANEKLLDFMQGAELGDELEVDYLRDGKTRKVSLTPRAMQPGAFSFNFDSDNFTVPGVPPPHPVAPNRFVWIADSGGFGDMELVKLTDDLGSYFGTTQGLLVVRAPEDDKLMLKDGDVILNIDGREPSSATHAMRILGSYESGESVKIEIMRNKRKQTVSVEVPETTNSWTSHSSVEVPAIKVVPPVKPVDPPESI